MRHDLTVEKYQAAYEKYQENRAKLLDWIATPVNALCNLQDSERHISFL